ncbi:phage tail protein [Pseudomonas sp. NFPP19]|uniref:phage tail protein n=1 Tax=Pseudomonas sp. NFPP19 TaxID=1566225 RepID=UPI0008AD6A1E|nr:phage tail protein [Pseudomonas sp. NFPP19]SEP91069.1 Phage Tail Collar Domain [Pseudomonas sp. NFPP19]
MDYPKSVPNVGLVNGKFVDENTATGQVGSLIPSSWGNAVTDELLNVIQAGGEQPAENDNDQLLAAIKVIVRDSIPPEKIRTTLAEYGITDAYTKSVTYTKAEIEALLKNMSALPVGAMVPFPKGTVPAGFLEVDGSVQSAAAYPDLSAYLGAAFNKGDEGAGNFRLPDSRGEFLRGWDHGRGVDAGRDVGSFQKGSLQTFDPSRSSPSVTGLIHTGADTDIAAKHSLDPATLAEYGQSQVVSIDNTTITAIGTAGGVVRPRNMAVMWCIKAWNAPVNQGNIDIAALAPLAAQATETNQGTAKLGTQEQIETGTDDSVIVTPKKMRLGFSMSLAQNGYVVFPSWLGGLVIQWGTVSGIVPDGSLNVSFPRAFPTACYSLTSSVRNTNGAASIDEHSTLQWRSMTNSGFVACRQQINDAGAAAANWAANYIAIGK